MHFAVCRGSQGLAPDVHQFLAKFHRFGPEIVIFPFLESFVLAITLDFRVRIDFRQFLFAQDL
jgi:hypothetical protein